MFDYEEFCEALDNLARDTGESVHVIFEAIHSANEEMEYLQIREEIHTLIHAVQALYGSLVSLSHHSESVEVDRQLRIRREFRESLDKIPTFIKPNERVERKAMITCRQCFGRKKNPMGGVCAPCKGTGKVVTTVQSLT